MGSCPPSPGWHCHLQLHQLSLGTSLCSGRVNALLTLGTLGRVNPLLTPGTPHSLCWTLALTNAPELEFAKGCQSWLQSCCLLPFPAVILDILIIYELPAAQQAQVLQAPCAPASKVTSCRILASQIEEGPAKLQHVLYCWCQISNRALGMRMAYYTASQNLELSSHSPALLSTIPKCPRLFNPSRDRDLISVLGSLCQGCTALSMERCFPNIQSELGLILGCVC